MSFQHSHSVVDRFSTAGVVAAAVAGSIVAAIAGGVAWPGAVVHAQDRVEAQAAGSVRGAHEAAGNPGKTFTDDLDLTVPEVPIDHPARVYPATDDFPTGPGLGERFPDFALSNQRGALIDFHGDRAGRKAVVAFIRSAVW
jgi:hypothetical protein